MTGRLMYFKLLLYMMAGNAKEMQNTASEMQSFYSPKNSPGAWMFSIYAMASSVFMSNEIDEVHKFYDLAFENRFAGRPFSFIHVLFIQCLDHIALGDWLQAESVLSKGKEFASEVRIKPLEGLVYSFEVELALRKGELSRAKSIAFKADFYPYPPLWYYYIPQLTQIRLLFATGSESKALNKLAAIIRNGEQAHNENLLIQAYALQASLLEKAGNRAEATAAISNALGLAADKNHFRTFLDYGDVIHQLLKGIDHNVLSQDQIGQLIPAFDALRGRKETSGKVYQTGVLSKRELEIVQLAASGYRNDEIANELFVSLDTIKKHLYNTYQKLHVSNRVSAINKVHEMGLIETDTSD